MKRTLTAAFAAVLALALAAGPTMAIPPGTIDQNSPPAGSPVQLQTGMTQTFTAGVSGQLTYIAVSCDGGTAPLLPDPVQFQISVSGKTATGTCIPVVVSVKPHASSATQLVFASGPFIVKGHHYTITFNTLGNEISLNAANADYSGGAAAAPGGGAIDGVTDFAFATFVDTNATPPPTGTAPSETPAPGGTTLWLLPALLAFGLGAYAVMERRKLGVRA